MIQNSFLNSVIFYNNEVWLNKKLKGHISNGNYYTQRGGIHFMIKFSGFGVSKSILLKLKEKGISGVVIEYVGAKGLKKYKASVDRFLASDKLFVDDSMGFEDPQLFLSVKEFEEEVV